MSDTDSFIEEVSEEVRKDKLFQQFRKWGWVAGLAVLLVVGGAAYNEYRKASERTAAQGFGDDLLAAIEADDQGTSLSELATETPGHAALAGHLAAADALAGDALDDGLSQLEGVSEIEGAPEIYRDLAALKRALAQPLSVPADERIAAFDALSGPGAPFAALAQEQKALILIEQDKTDDALALLGEILQGASLPPGMAQRASELIIALGGELPQRVIELN